MALLDEQRGDITVIGGDWNAYTGSSKDFQDGVCGRHGDGHLNTAGRAVRQLAASHSLVDLITWEHQDMNVSFFDHRNGMAKQLD